MKPERRDYLDFLDDISHYASKALQFVEGVSYESFASNEEKSLAVLHALQIIGEAANKLPTALFENQPELPIADMVGMRNFIAHGYFKIDLEIVWRTVHEDLPPMKKAIDRLIRRMANP